MALDYDHLCQTWDPWRFIPASYNLGVGLTHDQVLHGHGNSHALLWEDAAGRSQTFTYGQLDVLTNRLACSLSRLGIHAATVSSSGCRTGPSFTLRLLPLPSWAACSSRRARSFLKPRFAIASTIPVRWPW